VDKLPTKIPQVHPAVAAGWSGGEAAGPAIHGEEDKLSGGGPAVWVVMLVKASKSPLMFPGGGWVGQALDVLFAASISSMVMLRRLYRSEVC
jgi:hypothetical protein